MAMVESCISFFFSALGCGNVLLVNFLTLCGRHFLYGAIDSVLCLIFIMTTPLKSSKLNHSKVVKLSACESQK